MTKYPEAEQELFQKAITSYKNGEIENAISIMKQLIKNNPTSSAYNGYLGSIYFDTNRYHLSRNYFKKTIQINSVSETASLGYFHSLWNLGFIKAALREIERYSGLSHLKDYDEIIRNLKESNEVMYKKHQKYIGKIFNKINKLA